MSQKPRRPEPPRPVCPLQGGSSPDLSPSDSCGSGGTYMWDEEGLGPLGGATAISNAVIATRHGGSFDSDLNSIVRSVCVALWLPLVSPR